MRTFGETALLSLVVASTVMGPACGRDGLLDNQASDVEAPGGAVKVKRAFFLPNNLTSKWAAYQDGSGPWIPIQPIEQGGQEFELVLSDPSQQLGFAIAADRNPEYVNVVVSFLTVDDCVRGVDLVTSGPKPPATRSGNISLHVTGLANGDHATLSVAGHSFEFKSEWVGSGTVANASWLFSGDLLATAGPSSELPTRMIIRRNLRLADGMTIPILDFSSAEAFPLQAGQVTITGAPAAGETYAGVFLVTANGKILMSHALTTPVATVPFMLAPSAKLAAGDLYEATYINHSPAGSIRVTSYFHSPAGQVLAIPGILSGGKVSNSGGPGDLRLTAEWPVTEPGAIRHAQYVQGADMMHSKWWQVTVSPSYAAGAVTVPELRNVAGWDSLWDLAAGAATEWALGTSSSSSPDSSPRDGTLEVSTDQRGTIIPQH